MARQPLRLAVLCGSLVVLAGVGLPAGASPPPAGVDQAMVAVSADSASDAWAVGYRGLNFASHQAVVKHWDGTTWTAVPVQSPGTVVNELTDVAALSPTDVWVVGREGSSTEDTVSLIEHWDGTSFTVIPSHSQGYEIGGISALSAADIWLAGIKLVDGHYASLIEHWDGTAWRVVHSPQQPPDGGLWSIAAISTNDVWAGGSQIEHWNGRRWTIVTDIGNIGSLSRLSAVSPTDVWAVGYYNDGSGLIEHWDGTSWSQVFGTKPCDGAFGGLAAVAADNVWIVGGCSRSGPNERLYAEVENWGGSSWHEVTVARPGRVSALDGVSAVSPTDLWAVGTYSGHADVRRDLFEHWDGTSWTVYRDGGFSQDVGGAPR